MNPRTTLRPHLRRPGSSLLAVAILGLGIGLSAGVYSIAGGLILRGLPFPESHRLVAVGERRAAEPDVRWPAPYEQVHAWRQAETGLESLAFYQAWFSYAGWPEGGTEVYVGAAVSPDLFPLLRTAPQTGRFFPQEDCDEERSPAVMSDGVWRSRFGGSAEVLGTTVEINRRPHTVVGVAPPGFGFPFRQELWTLLCLGAPNPEEAGPWVFSVGRLRPGVTVEQVQGRISAISEGLRADRSSAAEGAADEAAAEAARPWVEPFVDSVTDPKLRRALGLVGGGAGLLLFTACCTVALLLLLDTLRRRRELAVRSALGASPARIGGESLLGALALSASGCLLGLGVAQGCLVLFDRLLAPSTYLRGFWVDLRLDGATVAVAVVAALTAVPLTGALPALRAMRTPPGRVLRGTAGYGMSEGAGLAGGLGWAGSLLVVGQVALTCLLLLGVGVTARSALEVARFPYGFDPEGLFTAKVGAYAVPGVFQMEADEVAALFLGTARRVRELPGVTGAAVGSVLPASAGSTASFVLPAGRDSEGGSGGDEPSGEVGHEEERAAWSVAVSPGWAEALGVPLLAGRDFNAADSAAAPPVVLVSRSFARRFLGSGPWLGRRVGVPAVEGEEPRWARVVGVVADSAVARLDGAGSVPAVSSGGALAGSEAFYRPLAQSGLRGGASMQLVVRTAGGTSAAATLWGEASPEAALRRAARGVHPDLAVWEGEAMTGVLARQTWVARAFTGLFGLFGAAATALACAVLYGVVALGVRRRRRELAIHTALGAGRRDLLWRVLRRGAAELAAGLALGLGVGLGAVRLLASRFEGVFRPESIEPWLPAAAVGLLALLGLAALVLPALRAVRLDSAGASVWVREG